MYIFATVGVFLFDGWLSEIPEALYASAKVRSSPPQPSCP